MHNVVGFLRRFSGLDAVPLDPSRLGPALHVRRDKLRSVVAAYRLGTSSLLTRERILGNGYIIASVIDTSQWVILSFSNIGYILCFSKHRMHIDS